MLAVEYSEWENGRKESLVASAKEHALHTFSNMEILIPWFPALTTTSALAIIVWLAREAITARLTKSVQHEFDRKLAVIRSDLTASEERLKATLREREAEISALRSGALSSLASRQAATDKRRLEAVDQLWEAFNSYSKARAIATTMSVVNFEEMAKATENNAKARQLFETIGGGFDHASIDYDSANKARPFVSAMVWAVFKAYSAVVMNSVMQWHILKTGLGAVKFANHELIKNLIVAVLPHYEEYLGKVGAQGYFYALQELEDRLIKELQEMLVGTVHDKAALERAAEIIRHANALQAAQTETNTSTRS